ncbi:hypothetical protein L3N51_02368 [Metallosphaera sp. J1]|uniref:PD-(D/E)XK nuclease family protein n=1 Tax=Metallosphaera javensis (ex Hofmann et al. 2022) TaxID=99938 RepID=UPI001EE0A7D4|nr:PD-(D/E)XK nuclease family protein [Metallosphaera javensis (ex Hofmann et al. 2022)]MCG3110071.1 hypothetical protein [Metallosphaera javensis (ex Hofmann et al. 2022)]
MTGVKDAARSTSSCDNFKMDQHFKKFIEGKERVHDDIKSEVRGYFERSGFKCHEEYELSWLNLRGRVDIMCSSGDDVVLIEIKSSTVSGWVQVDGLQLLIYKLIFEKTMMGKDSSNSPSFNSSAVHAVLVYRNPFHANGDGLTELSVGSRKVSVSKKYLYLLLKDNLEGFQETLENSSKDGKTYVMNKDCDICVNQDCPLLRSKTR